MSFLLKPTLPECTVEHLNRVTRMKLHILPACLGQLSSDAELQIQQGSICSRSLNVMLIYEKIWKLKEWHTKLAVRMLSMPVSDVHGIPMDHNAPSNHASAHRELIECMCVFFQGHRSSELPADLQRTGPCGQDWRFWDGSRHLQVQFQHRSITDNSVHQVQRKVK